MATSKVLGAAFFHRPALDVAQGLLGKFLVRRIGDEVLAVEINETEAYIGPEDLACHASKGCTPRTQVMFGPPGVWYVYFCYGIHWMLNVVTEAEGFPAAVLFRGAGEWNGPAKLTKALSIDKGLNGLPAAPQSGLWVEDRGVRIPPAKIHATPRIGIDYAGQWAARPFRFVVEERRRAGKSRRGATRG
jgi:DNA-3-methyladenine glycosylase